MNQGGKHNCLCSGVKSGLGTAIARADEQNDHETPLRVACRGSWLTNDKYRGRMSTDSAHAAVPAKANRSLGLLASLQQLVVPLHVA